MNGDAQPAGGGTSLRSVVEGYDRVARFYRAIEPLFLITNRARRKAVAALDLRRGDVVLELGAGTGRNLPYLLEAVGPEGGVIAVDASAGMLAEARRLVGNHGWTNVEILEQDAAELELDRDVDAVLFSLSYSAMPNPAAALARGWERLRPGRRVVVMDVGLTRSRLGPLLGPIARLLVKIGPGNAYTRPWEELARYGRVTTEHFMLGLYHVCFVEKTG